MRPNMGGDRGPREGGRAEAGRRLYRPSDAQCEGYTDSQQPATPAHGLPWEHGARGSMNNIRILMGSYEDPFFDD